MKGGGDCLFIIRERGKFSKAKARFNEYTLIQVLVGATKRQLEDTVCMASLRSAMMVMSVASLRPSALLTLCCALVEL